MSNKEVELKLISVQIINFKLINYAEIVIPESGILKIEGPNESGKSSVLDAFSATLGDRIIEPVQRNRKFSKCTLVWNKFTVIKKIPKAGNATLVIKDRKTGKDIKSPQRFLDALRSPVILDPTAFALNLNNSERINILYEITGIKVKIEKLEIERLGAYNERTAANGTLREYEIHLGNYADELETLIPEKSASDFMEKLEIEQEKATKLSGLSMRKGNIKVEVDMILKDIENDREQIQSFKRQITQSEADIIQKQEKVKKLRIQRNLIIKEIDEFPEPQIESVTEEIKGIDDFNKEARAVSSRNETRIKIEEARKKCSSLTRKIDKAKDDKLDTLSAAKLPKGLTIEDGEIKVNGLSWESQSTSQCVKTAMEIGKLDKSEMKLMRMSWNDLDEDSVQTVIEFVKKHNYLAIVESVSKQPTGDEGSVFLREGEIRI